MVEQEAFTSEASDLKKKNARKVRTCVAVGKQEPFAPSTQLHCRVAALNSQGASLQRRFFHSGQQARKP